MRLSPSRPTIGVMRERERPELPLPQRRLDRVLLGFGAAALLAVVPMLWIWLLYGSGVGPTVVHAAAIGLCVLTAGIGFAMLRILDGKR
jgi:hypothetical protein